MVQIRKSPNVHNASSSPSSLKGIHMFVRTVTILCATGVLFNIAVNWQSSNDEVRTLSSYSSTTTATTSTAGGGRMMLHYKRPSRQFSRTPFTLDEFVVNGVNLAQYGREDKNHLQGMFLTKPYQLYEDFSIAHFIQGDENWKDLVHYHRDLTHPSLTFYMDKVAQKRYMQAKGYPMPQAYVLHYQHELGLKEHPERELQVVSNLLPTDKNYVVKPTHKSCSSGVWLVRYDETNRQLTMGYSGHPADDHRFDKTVIAQRVTEDLHKTAKDSESIALKRAKPGFVVEERYSHPDSDTKAAYEFKTFTVWGRVLFGYLKRGSGDYIGLVYRDGTMMECQHKNVDWETIPDWLQWNKVVELAEELAHHKDMFRADIFVGLPSGSPELRSAAQNTQDALQSLMQIAISETEFHPTSAFKDKGILEEAARLWMAGYKMNIYTLIPNDEVPKEFLKHRYLSEEDAANLQRKFISKGTTWKSKLG